MPDGEPIQTSARPFTKAEREMIAEVFGRPEVQSDISTTVALLQREHPEVNWEYKRVYNVITRLPALAAQKPGVDPKDEIPSSAEVLDRPPILPPAELEEARALVKQDATLKQQDWTELGLSEAQGKRMLSMERFSQQPLKHMIHTTHGGLMFCLATLLDNFETTAERVRTCALPGEVDAKGDPRPEIDVERDWHKLLLSYTAEIRAITDQVTRSNVLILKAKQLEGEGKSGKKKGKPGFGALVKAEPGSHVHLHGG